MSGVKTKLKAHAVLVVRAIRLVKFRVHAIGRTRNGESFVVGPQSRIARDARIDVGDRVSIGANFVCEVNLSVGNDVLISSNVAFVGNDHRFDNPELTLQQQDSYPRSRVHLQGDNLIGFGTIVLGNITIGRGTIVGAGSLVTKDLPADAICYGRPAKPMKKRR